LFYSVELLAHERPIEVQTQLSPTRVGEIVLVTDGRDRLSVPNPRQRAASDLTMSNPATTHQQGQIDNEAILDRVRTATASRVNPTHVLAPSAFFEIASELRLPGMMSTFG
jgi:hypothetical protein